MASPQGQILSPPQWGQPRCGCPPGNPQPGCISSPPSACATAGRQGKLCPSGMGTGPPPEGSPNALCVPPASLQPPQRPPGSADTRAWENLGTPQCTRACPSWGSVEALPHVPSPMGTCHRIQGAKRSARTRGHLRGGFMEEVTHRFSEQSACNTRLIGRCQQVEAAGRSCCSRQDVSGFGDVALG